MVRCGRRVLRCRMTVAFLLFPRVSRMASLASLLRSSEVCSSMYGERLPVTRRPTNHAGPAGAYIPTPGATIDPTAGIVILCLIPLVVLLAMRIASPRHAWKLPVGGVLGRW